MGSRSRQENWPEGHPPISPFDPAATKKIYRDAFVFLDKKGGALLKNHNVLAKQTVTPANGQSRRRPIFRLRKIFPQPSTNDDNKALPKSGSFICGAYQKGKHRPLRIYVQHMQNMLRRAGERG